MAKKIVTAFLFCFLPALLLKAQLPDYPGRIGLLYSAIQKKLSDQKNGLYYETTDSSKNENRHSWLWPLCAFIQAANEMEVLDHNRHYMPQIEHAIDQYYSDKPPLPAYQDYVTKERVSSRFYDDNQWIAIAYLDAYKRTHRQRYLDVSKMIYRFMLAGVDSAVGGGIYWKEGDKNTKNTCSNGPGILIALQLYQITHEPKYLQQALSIYQWVNSRLQTPEGLYYDHIKLPSLEIGKAIYTYNTGTMLQANVLLYQITNKAEYLKEAKRVAAAARQHFFKNNRLPNGQYWFNAVMLRAYQDLYKIDRNPDWINFWVSDAESIWNTERDENNMVGPTPVKKLIDQAAMIEIYARLQQLKALK